jgi:hypothetical protein
MGIFQSKKFRAALVAIVVAIGSHYIPGFPEGAATEVVAVLVAYIIGQGIADNGKEAALVEAVSKADPGIVESYVEATGKDLPF